jgi:hypothetical protein
MKIKLTFAHLPIQLHVQEEGGGGSEGGQPAGRRGDGQCDADGARVRSSQGDEDAGRGQRS